MTISLSESILRELSRRSQPMTARSIAGSISHDLVRTRALISFMIGNGKLTTAGGNSNGDQTYTMTDKGRSLAEAIDGAAPRLHLATARPGSATAPAVPATASAAPQPAAPRAVPASVATPAATDSYVESAGQRRAGQKAASTLHAPNIHARFGTLNTGELLIRDAAGNTVILSIEEAAALRRAIGG